jgi:hypothetical protein
MLHDSASHLNINIYRMVNVLNELANNILTELACENILKMKGI